jgi:hypothetical protein
VRYEPDRVPALWRRASELYGEPDDWLLALKAYGPLERKFYESVPEERVREGWHQTLKELWVLGDLWKESSDGVFELPTDVPIELKGIYKRLQDNLAQMAAANSVRLMLHGLNLSPEPADLQGYIWLDVAEAMREKHRLKRCDRCHGWMRVQRSDTKFCSAKCRNWREAA